MPSPFANGVCSTNSNAVNKQGNRNCQNNRFTSSDQQKNQYVKASYNKKPFRSRGRNDNPMDSSKHVTVSVKHDTTTSMTRTEQQSTATASAAGPPATSMENYSVANDPHKSTQPSPSVVVGPMQAIYDTTQAYEAHMQQSYVPGVTCTVPNCSLCFSPNAAASSVAYLPPQFIPGSAYPTNDQLNPSAGAAPSPYYVWVGQDPETSKQLYQTQMMLSNMSLAAPQTAPACMSPECALGVPLFQSNVVTSSVPTDGSPAAAMNSSGNTATAILQAAQSEANQSSIDSTSAQLPTTNPSTTTSAYSESNQPTQTTYYAASGDCVTTGPTPDERALQQSGSVDVNAPTTWPGGGNYYGSSAYWIPQAYQTYGPSYYQPVPVAQTQLSPNSVVTLNDPSMTDVASTLRSNTLPLKDDRPASLQGYCMPNSNFNSHYYSNPVRFNLAKNQLGLNQAFNANPTSAQSLPLFNPQQWQLFLNAFAASRNPVQNNPLLACVNPAQAGVNRRRVPFVFNNPRSIPPKGLDPMELAQLKPTVNPKKFDESLLVHTRYFVIRSDSEYNVHQSIRHGVWCSTRAGNQCLDEAYQSVQVPSLNKTQGSTESHGDSSRSLPGHILLIFSVRSSGYLNGVAEMIGPVNPQKRCSIWQDTRFRGEIPVKWIYVKNVPNNLVSHISFESHENRPITGLRDTTEIEPASKAEEILRIIHNYGLVPTLPPAQV